MYEMEYTIGDIDVIVTFEMVGSYIRGSTDCYGCPEEPDEYPEVEIESIRDEDGNEVEIPSGEIYREILERCCEYAEGRKYD